MPESPNAYWNRRLDPLDWKGARGRVEPSRWDRAHRTYLDPATRDAVDLLGELAGKRLLEIGCGQGHGTLHLLRRGADVTAVDVSDRRCAAALAVLRDVAPAGSWRACAATAERLPFPDASFDAVFCRDVLMYTNPERVLADCHRVLVDGGMAVFVESLEGHAALRWFRRLTSPREYLRLTRHVKWSELLSLPCALERVSLRPYYLASLTGFFALFCLGSVTLHRLCLGLFDPLDRLLLKRLPALAHLAWRATAAYRKPVHG